MDWIEHVQTDLRELIFIEHDESMACIYDYSSPSSFITMSLGFILFFSLRVSYVPL